ncbi:MAG TPA: phosphate ABC transporter permease PstA [Candidatus Sulfomarinibacteraceae bacterium]|nr:phosphate ABC transporter permease PstA [Candidatus Sulfomarinibacteraceae bacterium]
MAANPSAVVGEAGARFEPNLMRRRLAGTVFLGLCLLAVGILLMTLAVLLWDIVSRGLPWLDGQFLTGAPSRRAERAGVLPALAGSIELALLVALITFPVGVAAAIYLEEYATANRLNRLLRTNIANLAGVPSIVYGIFGLALFVRGLGLGFTLLAGALTLSLLILPVVIIASIEALRAVPSAQREAAFALGGSRWQVVRGSVLPAAAPGILTGIILAMARAIGETAPLILVGAVTFVTFLPNPLEAGYTVLPIQIFSWAGDPRADFQALAAAAITVLLVLMLVLNALALVIRARLSRHLSW